MGFPERGRVLETISEESIESDVGGPDEGELGKPRRIQQDPQ
jgi:hypothetical protein